MQTPNFAMDTTDVDPNADRAQETFTTHVFDEPLERSFRISGSTVRVPSDMSTWPSSAFFDAIYGSAVLHHFGFAVADITEKWADVFYPGGLTKEGLEEKVNSWRESLAP